MLSRPRVAMLRTGTLAVLTAYLAVGCSRAPENRTPSGAKINGPLIDASVTMVAAWEFPKTPLADPSLDPLPLSDEVKRGFRIFTNTPHEAPQLAPGGMSCSNCHMNG